MAVIGGLKAMAMHTQKALPDGSVKYIDHGFGESSFGHVLDDKAERHIHQQEVFFGASGYQGVFTFDNNSDALHLEGWTGAKASKDIIHVGVDDACNHFGCINRSILCTQELWVTVAMTKNDLLFKVSVSCSEQAVYRVKERVHRYSQCHDVECWCCGDNDVVRVLGNLCPAWRVLRSSKTMVR